jgi:cytochrome P450
MPTSAPPPFPLTPVAAYWPASTRQLFGAESMINVAGEAHRALRRHVASAFSSKALRGYLQELQQLCCERCEAWAEQGQVGACVRCLTVCHWLLC